MSLDSLIRLLFERSGGLFETPSELVYFVNMKGLKYFLIQFHRVENWTAS